MLQHLQTWLLQRGAKLVRRNLRMAFVLTNDRDLSRSMCLMIN